MSSVRTLRSVTKISPSAKCKCPTTVISRPSRRSKETRGTRIPSKYSSQQGNCWNLNLIESMKEEQRKPSGKWRDEGCLPTLAQMVTGERGPFVTILTQFFILPPPPCPRDPRHPPQPIRTLETHSLKPPSKSPAHSSISRLRTHLQNLQPPQMT